MKRTSILLFLLFFRSAIAVQAQAQAPKPDPEVKKLHVWVGHWTLEGEAKPGPLGHGGKFSGEHDCRMILAGFFLQDRWTEKGPAGQRQGLEMDGYDPVNKNFSSWIYMDDGTTFSGVLTITGNTWTWAGKLVTAGGQAQYKGTLVLAPDLASWTYKDEFSPDGKAWTPLREGEFTKAKPARKK